MHKRQHFIQVKIFDPLDLGAFLYKKRRRVLSFFFFLKNFPFVSWTSIYVIYKFSWKNADIGCRSKFLINVTQGHFRTKFIRVFFLSRILHLFRGPLHVLSTRFQAQMPKYGSCQNSWLVGPRGIFVKKKLKFLFFLTNFVIVSFDLSNCYLEVFMHTCWHLIQVKKNFLPDLGAFSYKITQIFFL